MLPTENKLFGLWIRLNAFWYRLSGAERKELLRQSMTEREALSILRNNALEEAALLLEYKKDQHIDHLVKIHFQIAADMVRGLKSAVTVGGVRYRP